MPKSLWYSTSAVILLGILLFKPVAVFTAEAYLSSLLKTEVNVVYFHLFDLDIGATIKEKNNIANVKVNTLYPFQADIVYEGDADAFNAYHPLKAQASLKGCLFYKEMLQIDATIDALGAETDVKVNENTQGWDISVEFDGLDLAQLKDENNLSYEMSGIIDGDLDLHTAEDSTVKVSSGLFSINNQKFKDFALQASRADGNIYAWTLFDAEGFEYKGVWFHYDQNQSRFEGKAELVHKAYNKEIIVELNGERNGALLLARADIGVKGSQIDIEDITYDMNSSEMHADVKMTLKELEQHRYISELLDVYLHGDLLANARLDYKDGILKADVDMQSLGGNLQFDYTEDTLQWQVQELELAKLLLLLGQGAGYDAKVNTQGSFDKGILKAKVNTKSLRIADNEIKNIDVELKGPINDLESVFQLETPYANVNRARIKLKDLNTLSLEGEVGMHYLSNDIVVKANVDDLQSESSLEMHATSPELFFHIPYAKYRDSKLEGRYEAFIEPELSTLKERVGLDGSFFYDEVLKIDMMTKDMGGSLQAFINDTTIEVKGSDLSAEKLLNYLRQPAYAQGSFNLDAEGTPQDMAFTLNTKHLALSKKETGLDENLSGSIKGNLGNEKLILSPDIRNRYLDTSNGQVVFEFSDKRLKLDLPLTLKQGEDSLELRSNADIDLQEGVRATLSVRHKDDSFALKKLSYKEKTLQTDINIDIKELHNYKAIIAAELYGALKMSGKARYDNQHSEVVLTSDSLGGDLDIKLRDKHLDIDLKGLSAAKTGALLHKKGHVKKGYLNGSLTYDLEKGSGLTALDAKELHVQGMDIDSELKGLEDVLGLNIFAMGSSLYGKSFSRNTSEAYTEIQHMKLDAEILPDRIVSKDVAMSTKNYRFAVNADLKHNGGINNFEVAVLDRQGCAVLRQRLKGNISSPELVNSTGTAVVLLGSAPKSVLKTGGKVLDFGASVIDSSANFIWQKALRQDSKVTLVNDTMTKGFNVLSSGKEMIVSGQCKAFYSGEVRHPQ